MFSFARQHKLWLIPLLIGSFIAPCIWYFVIRDAVVPGTKYKRSNFKIYSEQFHVSEEDAIALQRVEDKMQDKIAPTESDWKQVETLVKGNNLNMRSFALRTVSRVSHFGHKQECIDLVTWAIHDVADQSNDGIISSCLSSLYEMRAPNVQEELSKYQNSKGRFTSFVVEQIRQKEAGRK